MEIYDIANSNVNFSNHILIWQVSQKQLLLWRVSNMNRIEKKTLNNILMIPKKYEITK